MAKKGRIAIIGAGLCGSVLSVLLRNKFEVTLIEKGAKKRPLFDEIECSTGEVNTSINRAEGLGGTTNYWHNALIELDNADLRNAGIDSAAFEKYYATAWSLFLSEERRRECDQIRNANHSGFEKSSWSIGHMVVPYARANAWDLANSRYPGDVIKVIHGKAEKIVPGQGGSAGHVVITGNAGVTRVDADTVLVCAGGLATPVLLARSTEKEDGICDGYHDHPMAYVAKVKLRPGSFLKTISCKKTVSADVRSGFVFEVGGIKTVFYLRPAMNMGLKSITGDARYILSDLRNDPFSPKKILRLLMNLDALKEAILFKTKSGFHGDHYSVLMLGEQVPVATRGITIGRGRDPMLNWHVTQEEHQAYEGGFHRFMAEFSTEIVASNVIPSSRWEYRTAAHHSGGSRVFLSESEKMELPFFSVKGLSNSFVCDASLLRAGGIANSGLTLVALSHRLAELLVAGIQAQKAFMSIVIEIFLWICAAGVLYTYAFYPAILYLLARQFGRAPESPRLDDAALPHISLLIAAHDEQAVIDDRIRNALSLDYPRDKIEIVIASDGSTDRTNEIVRHYADRGVRLLDYSVRRGKAAMLNCAMQEVRGEIVILSDANTNTEPDAARALVRWFNDERVGAVCGRLVLTDSHGSNNADGLYWRIETFLKKNESRLGALLGSNGAIYAIRKDQYVPIPNNTIIDDFVIPLVARLRHGSRIIYDQSAIAHEESSADIHAEYRRRARIGAGGWQAISLLWRLLNPKQGWIAFTFLSHKVLRWICPFLMLGAFCANLLLCGSRPYLELFIVQLAFYTIAGLGTSIPGRNRPARLARLAAMFLTMNAALLMGFLRWLQGPQSGMWSRTRRLREVNAGHAAVDESGWRILSRGDILIIAATVSAAILVMFSTWRNLVTVSFIDEELSYVLMTPVVIAWLVWVRKDQLRGCRARPAWFGLPIMLFGWLIHWYGFIYDPAIWRAGAVIVMIGAFISAAGRDVCARIMPALVAAVFLIPIDPTGRYHLAGPLEVVTAQTTQSVCDILGMTVERSGNLLSVNGLGVAVAEACNGMRMVLSLFLACYVVAFTYSFKPGVRFLLLASSPLVAIACNVVRLVPTVWMFGHASREAAERFHAVSGWVMTIFAFIFLMGLAQVFRVVWEAVAAIELSPSESDSSPIPSGLSVRAGL